MRHDTLTIVIVDDPVLISVHVDGHRTENDVREASNYVSDHRVIFCAHLPSVETDDTERDVKEEVGLQKRNITHSEAVTILVEDLVHVAV